MSEAGNNTRMWEELEPLVNGNIPDDVGEYLQRQTYDHQERLADSFSQLQERSTPAFRASTDAVLGAAMPTSFQESGHVRHALEQYDGQRVPGNHRVVGYLNWPDNLTASSAERTRAQLDGFIEANPHTPFGYFENCEPAPITIGGIRRVVTDSTMAICSPDALLVGHDADQRALNATHLQDLMVAYARSMNMAAGILPQVTHSRLPDHLPNMDHVIQWVEDPAHMQLFGGYFEPGPAFGAPHYRAVGGYNPADNLGETHNLLDAIEDSQETEASGFVDVAGAQLVISPRRLVKKLEEYHRVSDFWTGGTDFGAVHAYRSSAEDYSGVSDLPDAIHDERLREYGQSLIRRVAVFARCTSNLTTPEALTYAFDELEKIRQRLGGPDDMFILQR